jgi:hypothetical protein
MSETISKFDRRAAAGGRAILSSAILFALALHAFSASAQTVKLAWNPSSAAGVAGYMIHYGTNSVNYSNELDAGNSTSWPMTDMQPGVTNYFVVSAYDSNHVESAPSNVTAYYVPALVVAQQPSGPPPGQLAVTGAGPRRPAQMSFSAVPGQTYEIQASTDLVNWVTIWQTTAASNGTIQFTDPEAVNLKMRFYRTITD